jgi:rhamnogalacturonyl hydrolase YesR
MATKLSKPLNSRDLNSIIAASFEKLRMYCEHEEFKGYDPYDGLNGRLFQSLPIVRKSRLARLAWIQFFKRSPINFRPIAGVAKDYNPKAMGLFLSGYCQLYLAEPKQEYLQKIDFFIREIRKSVSIGYSGACWGYNFDWQARAFYQPKFTPTVVASVFIASALLDAYAIKKDVSLLEMAKSTCNFILKDLNRTFDEDGNFAFSYSPLDKSVVFNASLLGSRLLSRVYTFTGEKALLYEAKKSIEYCCRYQQEDGSWAYGILPFHQWIDNFHTGYNLECISDYAKFSGDQAYEGNLNRGLEYYINTFFTSEGISKYFSNYAYPIDIHAPAQLIITLSKLGISEKYKHLIESVLLWTIQHMQSGEGYFYYQINKYFSSRISYIRWAQAWMFYALSTHLYHEHDS